MFVLVLVILAVAIYVVKTSPTYWNEAVDGDFQQAFLANVGKQEKWEFPMKETLSRILTAWREKKCGGVILQHDVDEKEFQVIEFKRQAPSKMEGIPMIGVKWTRTSSLQEANTYLRLYPHKEVITCTDETFKAVVQHMSHYCRMGDQIDAKIAVPVFEGYLSSVARV